MPPISAIKHASLVGWSKPLDQLPQTSSATHSGVSGSLATVLIAAALTACGGGGGSADPQTPLASAGVYYGQTANVSPRNYPTLIIRSNGDFWVFNEVARSAHGVGFGTATEQASQITSNTYRYLSASSGVTDGRLTGTYRTRLSLGGTIIYPAYNQTLTYAATYLSLPTLVISNLARTWTARDDAGVAYNLTIGSNGAFTASSARCTITGGISAPDAGLAVAPIEARSSDGCRLASQSLTGVIYSKVGDYWTEIWVGLVKTDRTDGTLLHVRQCLPGVSPVVCDP